MRTIYVDWVGFAKLVDSEDKVPTPKDFVIAMDGYRCYKTSDGIYAVEE